jgi:Low affinity iron permease/Histidine kinase-like ATPase domain
MGSIFIKVISEDLTLPPKHANTIGLIANELVTNTYKHAFEPGKAGNVSVTLNRSKTRLTLAVEDDGKGCLEDAQDGVGSQLIRLLVAQLEGEVMRHRKKRAAACRSLYQTLPFADNRSIFVSANVHDRCPNADRALGPVFNYSDTWQLVINTGTTVATFLMFFVLQHSQKTPRRFRRSSTN